MTIYTSGAVDAGIMPDNMLAGGLLNRKAEYVVTTSALAANDVIQMIPIPEGAMIVDMRLVVTNAGSHGSFDVGDDGAVDRFFNGLTGHMSGGSAVDYKACQYADGASPGMNYVYTADNTIDVKWLQSGCTVNTKIQLSVTYTMTGTIEDETP